MPVSDRVSILYLEYGILERDGHSVVLKQADRLTLIPVGASSVLMLGPGTAVTHQAIVLCAQERTLLLWAGENGVRLYAAGNPRSRSDGLILQATLHANPETRLRVARMLYLRMFDEPAPERRSLEQLRGIEGARVKKIYFELAQRFGVDWGGRDTRSLRTPIDAALAGVNAALYGLCEAVILALGYSPAIGFVHSGDPRSFVFDIADTVKFKTVVPLAFKLASAGSDNMEHRSRVACREYFYAHRLADQLVQTVEEVLSANGSS